MKLSDFIIIALLFTFSTCVFAQQKMDGKLGESVKATNSVIVPDSSQILANPSDTLWDTFEFIQDNEKVQEVYSTEIIPMLEQQRDETDVKYIRISDNTVVKILPKSIINSEEFRNKRKKLQTK
ncbi:MAG: hypothetical protein HY738_07640 [Bacteroidia bacterium]|nr:hypothetical protein [Bacteroidia bacterium]